MTDLSTRGNKIKVPKILLKGRKTTEMRIFIEEFVSSIESCKKNLKITKIDTKIGYWL